MHRQKWRAIMTYILVDVQSSPLDLDLDSICWVAQVGSVDNN